MTTLRDAALGVLALHEPDAQGHNVSTPKLLRALIQFAPSEKGVRIFARIFLAVVSPVGRKR